MRYGLFVLVCILVAIFATCSGDAGRNSGSGGGGGVGGGGGGKGRTGTGVTRAGRRKANKVPSTTPSSSRAGDASAAKPEGAGVDSGAVTAANVRRKCRKDSDGNCIKRKTDRSRNRNARRKKNSKRRQDVSSTPSSGSASDAAGAPPAPTVVASV